MRRITATAAILMLGLGSVLLHGCGSLSDCFGEDTLSQSEYDDLNAFEQLLYEENECGRYERR